ncbi:MAG: class I SAM-dependent methyltransferase [Burkholderiales bacterium]
MRAFWEPEPCGTARHITDGFEPYSREWFEGIEEHRYRVEPMIPAVARFESRRGKSVLEVGVGAGTDHLQWARAGCKCFGVDLTDAAIDTTRRRLALYGFTSTLRKLDAEHLPFDDAMFDVVYSWGVIHHAEDPNAIIAEVRRVLRPGGRFIGMVYGRHSLVAFKHWVRHGLLRGRPLRTWADVIWHHMESPGTKAYTVSEVDQMLSAFNARSVRPFATSYDVARLPGWFARFLPNRWGWFIAFEVTR